MTIIKKPGFKEKFEATICFDEEYTRESIFLPKLTKFNEGEIVSVEITLKEKSEAINEDK